MARVMVDCRRYPNEAGCSLTLIGEEEEVVHAARQHGVSAHGYTDDEAFLQALRDMMEPAETYSNDREPQPQPG